MLRKILTIAIVAVLFVSFGCKKKSDTPVVPEVGEVQKQVDKEITEQNMDEQLNKIEKDVQKEIAQ